MKPGIPTISSGGGRVVALLLAAVIGFAVFLAAPATSRAAQVWHDEYSCQQPDGTIDPNQLTPCGGSGWSCTHTHDGSNGTSPNGDEEMYHFYVCTWAGGGGSSGGNSGGSSGGNSGGSSGGTTTPTCWATVIFKANTGSYDTDLDVTGMPDTMPVDGTCGDSTSISPSQPSRDGYTFKGWNKNRTATRGSKTPTIAISNTEITLYAIWEKNGPVTSTLTFRPNGSTSKAFTKQGEEGSTLSMPDGGQAFTPPEGLKFKEWNSSKNGDGISYTAGETYTFDSTDRTVYAIWEKDDSVSAACVPVTGAPVSDWMWPAMGLAIGIAGVAWGLAGGRRQRRSAE